MHVSVISPEAATFDGPADSLVAPAFDGEVGILPRHAPFMTLLGEGTLVVRTEGGERRFHVRGGFLQVVEDTVRVVTEYVEEVSDAA
jgi:F-type H+-transporting ATPase subunit epsilon